MGHYASEMMCNTCGQCRCTCPPKPDKSLEQWVVDSDYSVIQAKAFDAKYDHFMVGGMKMPYPGHGRMLRSGRKHFDTQAEAQNHALALLDKNISASDAHTAELRARRKELTSS